MTATLFDMNELHYGRPAVKQETNAKWYILTKQRPPRLIAGPFFEREEAMVARLVSPNSQMVKVWYA